MAGARYWRVRAFAGGSNFSLGNIEFRATAGGADLTVPGGPVLVSSIFSNTPTGGGFFAAYAIDGDNATFWASGGGGNIAGQWIGYDFGAAVEILEIAMRNRHDAAFSQAPSSCSVDFSHDGANWQEWKWYSGLAWPAANTTNVLAVPAEAVPVAARVEAFAAAVLSSGRSAARVEAIGLEVLRDNYSGGSAARLHAAGVEVLRSIESAPDAELRRRPLILS